LQVVMVNSSWTQRHISELWWQRGKPARVYPPCDTRALQALPLDRRLKRLYLLSIAQFRPEKDHAMQLRALAAARGRAAGMQNAAGDAVLAAHLKLVGSCRNEEDRQRIEQLKGACACA
jgi:alpha-1,2-mannosyltransferase